MAIEPDAVPALRLKTCGAPAAFSEDVMSVTFPAGVAVARGVGRRDTDGECLGGTVGDTGGRSKGEGSLGRVEGRGGPVVGEVGDVDGAEAGGFVVAAGGAETDGEAVVLRQGYEIAARDDVMEVARTVRQGDGWGLRGCRWWSRSACRLRFAALQGA